MPVIFLPTQFISVDQKAIVAAATEGRNRKEEKELNRLLSISQFLAAFFSHQRYLITLIIVSHQCIYFCCIVTNLKICINLYIFFFLHFFPLNLIFFYFLCKKNVSVFIQMCRLQSVSLLRKCTFKFILL